MLQFGALVINLASYEVTLGGAVVGLTPTEFQLLKLLVSSPGRVFSRDELAYRVVGTNHVVAARTLDVHIHHLRMKLAGAGGRWIETVRGAGYRFSAAAGDWEAGNRIGVG